MVEITLTENDVKSFESAMNNEMSKVVKHFEGELIKIRTGRAHTSMVEDLQVAVYGQPPVALKSLASIAAPEARLITIQPWDASIIFDIERAITSSDLGVSPVDDGALIRIQLPEMSTSRRDDLTKTLSKKLEESRVSIRNVRKDFNNLIRDAKKEKTISENFFNRLSDVLQKVTDAYIEKVEKMAEKKELELKSV